MNDFRADLHCHSTCSDGTMSPTELVRHAKAIGLSGLSITDHDSIDAYDEALPLAKELGLEMISGAEFSSVHQGHNIHILAYSFPLNHPAIKNLCERHKQRRSERNRAILAKLDELGMHVELPESGQHNTLGRPHIANALVEKGYVKNIEEAFHKFLGDGKCCYVFGKPVSAEETIAIIHEAGGLAIIAHPHLLKNGEISNSLISLPFDGIECYYARFPPPQEKAWVAIAQRKNWLVTGGSDFHGTVKPDTPLGASWVNQETFTILKNHYQRHGA